MKNRGLILLLLLAAATTGFFPLRAEEPLRPSEASDAAQAIPPEPESAAPQVEVSTAVAKDPGGFRINQNPQTKLAAEVLRAGVERFSQNAVLLRYWELLSGKAGEENLQPLASDPATQDQIKEALGYLDSKLKTGKENPELLRIAGLLNQSLGLTDQAEQSFKGLLEASPNDVGGHFMLALIYEKKKLPEKAIEAWTQCLTLTNDTKLQIIANKHLQYLQQPGP